MSEKIEFDTEYALQHLTNDRLKCLFGLDFITAEFQFKGFKIDGLAFKEKCESLRIDGLAYHKETNSFVILEYKNKLDFQVFEQGKNYYYNLIEEFDGEFKKDEDKEYYRELLQINKDKLFEKYKDKFKEDFKEDDDGLKAKVIFIGPKFSKNQKESESPKYPHEIYTVSLYKFDEINGYALYEGINLDFEKQINVNLGNLKLTLCTLLNDKSDEIKELYKNFESKLLDQFKDLDIKYLVDAVSIKSHDEYICLINVKNSIKVHFYHDDFGDEKLNLENIGYIIGLIDKVYKKKVNKND